MGQVEGSGEIGYLTATLLRQESEAILKLVNISYCVSTTVHIHERCGFTLPSLLFSDLG
jgi:hypothetical protein